MPRELTHKAEKQMEEQFARKRRMAELFDIICAEFKSDPTSTQCFDSRIVQEAILLNESFKKSAKELGFFG